MHLMRAGHLDEAFDAMMAEAVASQRGGEHVLADELVDLCDYVLTAQGAESSDPRWGAVLVVRGVSANRRGKLELALNLSSAVIERGLLEGWGEHRLRAMSIHGGSLFLAGRLDEAQMMFEAMGKVAKDKRVRWAHGRSLVSQGIISSCRGDHDVADGHFAAAYKKLVTGDDKAALGDCFRGRATNAFAQGKLDSAGELFAEAAEIFQQLGEASRLADALTGLAEVERHRGNLDEAELRYREVLSMYEQVGSVNVGLMLFNLGLTFLARGQYERATFYAEQALAWFEDLGSGSLIGGAHAQLLPCTAHAEDWERWDKCLAKADTLISKAGIYDPDDAWCVQLGGYLAAEAGQIERARAAYAFATRLWERMHRREKLAEVRSALASLPSY
jgi:tetratricopeptide (TPR) repeat protein